MATRPLTIYCKWESYVTVDVDEDWGLPADPDDWPQDIKDQVHSGTAELVDWWTVRKPGIQEPEFPGSSAV